jgi:triacylglycerol esterase/lipase EstA (alpha/beta hydrolase family)
MGTIFPKLTAIVMAIFQAFSAMAGSPAEKHIRNNDKPVNLFVNGILSYGEKSGLYYIMPSYGITGNALRMLEDEGYECYAASPGPFSSNWDRVCNLYAELTGTRVDYGKAHSEKYGHERYGRDYKKPLIEGWDERSINLIGYSLGGPTVYLFSQLLEEGWKEERDATPAAELSPLFKGGMGDLIHSVTTLNGSMNGSTIELAYEDGQGFTAPMLLYALILAFGMFGPLNGLFDVYLDNFNLSGVGGSQLLHLPHWGDLSHYFTSNDHAWYDISPGGAQEFNMKLHTLDHVYYFSYASNITEPDGKGNWTVPTSFVKYDIMASIVGNQMGKGKGKFYGKTYQSPAGPFTIDESWYPNDGQVNLISAKYPFGAPNKTFDAGKIERGKWQVMPVLEGHSHMFFAGMEFKYTPQDLKDFFMAHFKVLDQTY